MVAPALERAGRRLKLTPHGAELLPAVSNAFEEIAAAAARLSRPTSSGALSISCVPALLSFWLVPRLASFTAQFPDVSLTFNAANDPAEIHSPDVDLCILYGNGDWPDCWVKFWTRLDLFPVNREGRRDPAPGLGVLDERQPLGDGGGRGCEIPMERAMERGMVEPVEAAIDRADGASEIAEQGFGMTGRITHRPPRQGGDEPHEVRAVFRDVLAIPSVYEPRRQRRLRSDRSAGLRHARVRGARSRRPRARLRRAYPAGGSRLSRVTAPDVAVRR